MRGRLALGQPLFDWEFFLVRKPACHESRKTRPLQTKVEVSGSRNFSFYPIMASSPRHSVSIPT